MDYTKVPETLLYKRKSLDKLVMLHPLNAFVIKRLLKIDYWDKNYDVENQIYTCLNNAYYICTIMRLEFNAIFRELSYQRIARRGHIEGSDTLFEGVTLSLVVLLIEHSTPEWRLELQEVIDDLSKYTNKLVYEKKGEFSHEFPGVQEVRLVLLSNFQKYLSKDIDASWVLPDDLFQPRTIDDKAIFELHRQSPTFNWDRIIFHYDEDGIQELIETLGKTQIEKATLIHSIWKDIYYSRKQFDGPIKATWVLLKALAQEFCPDCIEITELNKIPETGIEFEKRISELTEENERLKKQLAQQPEVDWSETEAQSSAAQDYIKELEDKNRELTTFKEEMEDLSRISTEEKLAIDERAIFFSSAIGLDFDPKRTNQKQLSTMISTLSGDNPESIRGRISKMHKMEKNNHFSEEVLQAARNVKGLLEKVPQGNQPQKLKDIIDNIDLVFLNSNNS